MCSTKALGSVQVFEKLPSNILIDAEMSACFERLGQFARKFHGYSQVVHPWN